LLDPWIIEEIRRREQDERRRREEMERPGLEIPRHTPPRPPEHEGQSEDSDRNRGVVIVDYGV
jgi:hypothetical protein